MTRVPLRCVGAAAAWFLVLTGLVFSGLIQHGSDRVVSYTDPGDAYVSIWTTWWRQHAHLYAVQDPRLIPIVAHPFGRDLSQEIPEPLVEWPLRWLSSVAGEVAAYNLLVLLGFVLTGLATFLLVYALTHNPWAGLLSGTVFAFCPYRFAHLVHISLSVGTCWLPLYGLALLWLWQRPTAGRALLLGAVLAGTAATNGYYAWFCAILSVVFLPILAWAHPTRRRFAGWSGVAVAMAAVAVWPLMGAVVLHAGTPGAGHPLKDLFVYSAKPWDYLLPPSAHWFFGPMVRPFLESHLYGSNLVEQTLFLGFVPLLLAGVAVWRAGRPQPLLVRCLLGGAIVAALCSGPPYLPLGPFQIVGNQIVAPWKLYLPSAMFHPLLPEIRVYARFGIVVALAVSVLAGLAIVPWVHRCRLRYRPLLLGGLLAAVAGDFTVGLRTTDVSSVPPAYQWLARQPLDRVTIEYPLRPGTSAGHARYLWYQRIHRHRLVNGATDGAAEALRLRLVDLTDPTVPGLLQALGVAYVLVHPEEYAEDSSAMPTQIRVFGVTYTVPDRHRRERVPPPPKWLLPGLELVQDFGDTRVYTISATQPSRTPR